MRRPQKFSDSKSSLCLGCLLRCRSMQFGGRRCYPAPFINPAMIHRSNALLSHSGQGYGQGFSYHESMNVSSIAPWPCGAVRAGSHVSIGGPANFLAALGEDSVRRKSALALWQGLASQPSKISAKDLDGVNYQLDVCGEPGAQSIRSSLAFTGEGNPGLPIDRKHGCRNYIGYFRLTH